MTIGFRLSAPRLRVKASYEARGDLARLAPDLVPRCEVALHGHIELGGDTPGSTATGRVEAHGLAAEALARIGARAVPPVLALAGSEVDVEGDLEFDLTSLGSSDGLRADAIRDAAALA